MVIFKLIEFLKRIKISYDSIVLPLLRLDYLNSKILTFQFKGQIRKRLGTTVITECIVVVNKPN